MKAVVAAFNQEKALVGAFSVIVQPLVEPMDRFAALGRTEATLCENQTVSAHRSPAQPSRPPPHRWRERAELIDQEFISDSDSGHCLGTRNVETFIINISWSWHFVIQSATCLLFKPIFAFNILNLLKSWPLKITYLILCWMRSLIDKFNWLVCLIVAACGDI